MLATQLHEPQVLSHRRTDDAALLIALANRDPLALAEAYHRTVQAGNACARRLLPLAQIEPLLQRVYSQLWDDPPQGGPLEGWVRARCYSLATEELRARGTAPVSPSAAALLPDLPAPDVRYLDAAERALAELDEAARSALLLAHDCGVPASAQRGDSAAALERALRSLAGPEPSSADATALSEDPCTDVRGMADWALGLAEARTAAAIERLIGVRPGCAALARTLRRGRRRIEGLPAAVDMGGRILVSIVAGAPTAARPLEAPPAPRSAPPAAAAEPLSEDDGWMPPLREEVAPAMSAPHEAAPHTSAWPEPDEAAPHTSAWPESHQAAPNELETGELARTGELPLREAPVASAVEASEPQRESAVTSTEWAEVDSDSMTAMATGPQPAVAAAQLAPKPATSARFPRPPAPDEEADPAPRPRRANPYAELEALDDRENDLALPDPHRVQPTAVMATLAKHDERDEELDGLRDDLDLDDLDRSGDLDALFSGEHLTDEELITRPSVGQRLLVAMGYLLPIILGAGLGLWIADVVFR